MKSFIIFVFAVGATIAIIMNVHILKYDEGFKLLVKNQPTFDQTYIDATDTGPIDYLKFPEPVQQFLRTKTIDGLKEKAGKMIDSFSSPDKDQAATQSR
jgi:hypothetical protein